jgi:hypothetical protein
MRRRQAKRHRVVCRRTPPHRFGPADPFPAHGSYHGTIAKNTSKTLISFILWRTNENSQILRRGAADAVSEGADERPISGEQYRETARWFREIAAECRDAREREEFMRLAELFDCRGEQLDRRSRGGETWMT